MAIKRRKIPPMPIEAFALHPKVLAMNSAGYGAVARLLFHFWMTDCAPLPETDYARFLIARAHKPTWATYRADIREILDEICPELRESLALYRKRRSVLDHLSERGVSARQSVRLERRLKLIDATPAIGSPDRSQIAERNRAPAPTETPLQSGFREKIR